MRISDWSSDVCSSDLANPNLWTPDRRDFDQVNRLGTLNVLAAAERHRPERVVYTSTESILAGLRGRSDGGMIDESVALRVEDMPGSYCRSKFLAERAALEAAARGLPRSEEHTSELQSLMRISYAVFCLKKKNQHYPHTP